VSFEIRLEGIVRIHRSPTRKEGIPKQRAGMLKTTRGKSNVNTSLGEEIEGQSEANAIKNRNVVDVSLWTLELMQSAGVTVNMLY